ncbi:chromosomal replication initiator DnaA [Taklimakanibacter lacteus]|uniref:chromosomal replication initiator DnaA n=1 Tax=Taklimakanibacter lacteus TaxID=2268456 RepID=UPI0034D4F814
MGEGRQLAFDLPHRPASGRDDFLVTPSNAKAVALIDLWPNWPSNSLILLGPPGSGKSHLAAVWHEVTGAALASPAEVQEPAVPRLLEKGALVVEDAPGARLNEPALFHLLNLAREQKAFVLITARQAPVSWGIAVPDLLSRLKAAPIAQLGAPDDDLLRGVLVKLFADRQIAIDETVVSYLLARMPRELAAARSLVAEIDRRALEERAEVTRNFVARVLGGITTPGFAEDEG